MTKQLDKARKAVAREGGRTRFAASLQRETHGDVKRTQHYRKGAKKNLSRARRREDREAAIERTEVADIRKLEPWLLNLVELAEPLEPGSEIGVGGKMALVYEVRRLMSSSTAIAGARRDLFVVLHAGAGSAAVVFLLENGLQREWVLTPEQARAFKGRPAAPRPKLTPAMARALLSAETSGWPGATPSFKANIRTIRALESLGLARYDFTHGEDDHYADLTPAGVAEAKRLKADQIAHEQSLDTDEETVPR